MIPRVSRPRSFNFVQQCGNSDRLTRFMTCPLVSGDTSGAATATNDERTSRWHFRHLRSSRWKTHREARRALGKRAGDSTSVTSVPSGGTHRLQLMKRRYRRICRRSSLCGGRHTARVSSGPKADGIRATSCRCPDGHQSTWIVRPTELTRDGKIVGVSCDANFVDCRAVIWDHCRCTYGSQRL